MFRHEGGRVLRRARETNGIFGRQEAQGVHHAFLGEGLHRAALSLVNEASVAGALPTRTYLRPDGTGFAAG